MSYPSELLPKSNYKKIITEELPQDSVIIRTTDEKVVLDELEKIPEKYIVKSGSEKQVFDLSVNLYGVYRLEYIKIQPIKGSGLDNEWKEGDFCLTEVEQDKFEVQENKEAIFFLVFDIHNTEIPYKKEINGQTSDFEAICKVIHKPTVGNFWHFEVSYNEESGNIIQYGGSSWQKRLRSSIIRSFLKLHAKISIQNEDTINEDIYTKI